jgi:hypothetical protein
VLLREFAEPLIGGEKLILYGFDAELAHIGMPPYCGEVEKNRSSRWN